MSKFHIKPDGTIGVCKAQKGKCPYGSEADHYSSVEEASKAFQQRMEQEYGYTNKAQQAALEDAYTKVSNDLEAEASSLSEAESKYLDELETEAVNKDALYQHGENSEEINEQIREIRNNTMAPAVSYLRQNADNLEATEHIDEEYGVNHLQFKYSARDVLKPSSFLAKMKLNRGARHSAALQKKIVDNFGSRDRLKKDIENTQDRRRRAAKHLSPEQQQRVEALAQRRLAHNQSSRFMAMAKANAGAREAQARTQAEAAKVKKQTPQPSRPAGASTPQSSKANSSNPKQPVQPTKPQNAKTPEAPKQAAENPKPSPVQPSKPDGARTPETSKEVKDPKWKVFGGIIGNKAQRQARSEARRASRQSVQREQARHKVLKQETSPMRDLRQAIQQTRDNFKARGQRKEFHRQQRTMARIQRRKDRNEIRNSERNLKQNLKARVYIGKQLSKDQRRADKMLRKEDRKIRFASSSRVAAALTKKSLQKTTHKRQMAENARNRTQARYNTNVQHGNNLRSNIAFLRNRRTELKAHIKNNKWSVAKKQPA
jgi:superoxide dismutase